MDIALGLWSFSVFICIKLSGVLFKSTHPLFLLTDLSNIISAKGAANVSWTSIYLGGSFNDPHWGYGFCSGFYLYAAYGTVNSNSTVGDTTFFFFKEVLFLLWKRTSKYVVNEIQTSHEHWTIHWVKTLNRSFTIDSLSGFLNLEVTFLTMPCKDFNRLRRYALYVLQASLAVAILCAPAICLKNNKWASYWDLSSIFCFVLLWDGNGLLPLKSHKGWHFNLYHTHQILVGEYVSHLTAILNQGSIDKWNTLLCKCSLSTFSPCPHGKIWPHNDCCQILFY